MKRTQVLRLLTMVTAFAFVALFALSPYQAYGEQVSEVPPVIGETATPIDDPAVEQPDTVPTNATDDGTSSSDVVVDGETESDELRDNADVKTTDAVVDTDEATNDADVLVEDESTLSTQSVANQGVATQDDGELHVTYTGHVQKVGWQSWVKDGVTAGTSGRSLRIEALRIRLVSDTGANVAGIRYQAHVQRQGWQGWVTDGALAGTSGMSRRVEALRISLTESLSPTWDIWYRLHVQGIGWLGWASNGATAGTSSMSKRVEAIEIVIQRKGTRAPGDTRQSFVDGTHLSMRGHIQRIGWQSNDDAVGTVGLGLRIEGFSAKLACGEHPGGVAYSAHVQRIGWQSQRSDGAYAGTTGMSRRVEAVKLALTGEAASHYDLWYRVHVQRLGWLGWTKDNAPAGSSGLSLRTERIETRILPKGSPAPSSPGQAYDAAFVSSASIAYRAKDVGSAWQGEVSNGKTAGTTGDSTSIERFSARLVSSSSMSMGDVVYRIRSTNGTWTECSAGAEAGVSGRAVDQIAMRLTGNISNMYTIHYRVHVNGVGWLEWASSNAVTGTAGIGKSIDGIQVRLVFKGNSLPSNDDAAKGTIMYDREYDQRKGQPLSEANSRQRAIVNAALSTPSPGSGLCAAWVENVYENAGYGTFYGNADDLYNNYCHSNDLGRLKVGMIIAVSTHTKSYLGGIYGHVGIYIGDGWVMDNIGSIRKIAVENWMDYYGTTVPPKWGWLGNINIA